jgi:2,3-bisphosphoglycerate-dependent phosphoglycerate mutase
MLLYLIRHAQSQNNALPEEQRVEDPGITELGREQAKCLAEWMPSLQLTRLYTSPFRRTLQTTEPICRTTSLTPEVRTALHEKGGCYHGYTPKNIVGRPGMTAAQIESEFPGFRIAGDIDGQGWWNSKPYETEQAARMRAGVLYQRTREEFANTDERVAFVMHADVKVLFLEHLDFDVPECPCNTSVTTIQITPEGNRLEEFNRVAHLPADSVTR